MRRPTYSLHHDPPHLATAAPAPNGDLLPRALCIVQAPHVFFAPLLRHLVHDNKMGTIRVAIVLLFAILSRSCGFVLGAPSDTLPSTTRTSASRSDRSYSRAGLLPALQSPQAYVQNPALTGVAQTPDQP